MGSIMSVYEGKNLQSITLPDPDGEEGETMTFPDDFDDFAITAVAKAALALRGYIDDFTMTGAEFDIARSVLLPDTFHQSYGGAFVTQYIGPISEVMAALGFEYEEPDFGTED